MAGITDRAFRELCEEFFSGRVYTEMVSINALFFENQKTEELLPDDARCICQIFGRDPDRLEAISERLNRLNCAGFDINCGCPMQKIVKNGDGSQLMREPEVARALIERAVRVLNKPVSVKFRLGWDWDSINAPEFAKMCEQAGASFVAVHGRTRSDGYDGRANLDEIRRVKEAVDIPVIANGDVRSAESARRMLEATGCDGVMIGRGVLGSPWVLAEVEQALGQGGSAHGGQRQGGSAKDGSAHGDQSEGGSAQLGALKIPSPYEVALRHFELLLKYKPNRAVLEMRKHAAWYVKGMRGASEMRRRVITASSREEMLEALKLLENAVPQA